MKIKLIDIIDDPISGEWGEESVNGEGIPVLRTTNFTNEGIINYSEVAVRNITKQNLSCKFLRRGDIIIEKSGGSDKQPVGRVVYFDGDENTYLFNNFTSVLRVANRTLWNTKYVFYALYINYLRGGTIAFQNKTTGLHNLKLDQYIKGFLIEQKSIDEQETIVKNLDKITRLVEKRQEQLENFDLISKSKFIEMFGDAEENPYHYDLYPIEQIAEELFAGGDKPSEYSSMQTSEYLYPVFSNGEKDGGLLCYAKKYRVNKEAITISARGTIGYTCIRKPFFTPVVRLITFVPKQDVNIIYLKRYLDMTKLTVTGTSQGQLTVPEFKKLLVKVPPLGQQDQFADFVKQVDRIKFMSQQSLEKLTTLKNSLMQKYFGSKI